MLFRQQPEISWASKKAHPRCEISWGMTGSLGWVRQRLKGSLYWICECSTMVRTEVRYHRQLAQPENAASDFIPQIQLLFVTISLCFLLSFLWTISLSERLSLSFFWLSLNSCFWTWVLDGSLLPGREPSLPVHPLLPYSESAGVLLLLLHLSTPLHHPYLQAGEDLFLLLLLPDCLQAFEELQDSPAQNSFAKQRQQIK